MAEPKSDHDMLVEIHANVANACQDIGILNKAVFGNSNPGLTTRVTVLETRIAMLLYIGGIVTAAALTAAVTSIWQLIAK